MLLFKLIKFHHFVQSFWHFPQPMIPKLVSKFHKIIQTHFFLKKHKNTELLFYNYHGKCEKSNRKTKPKRNLKEAVNCCEFHNYDCQKMFLCVTYQGMFSYFWYLPQMNTQLRLKKCWTYIAKIRPCSFRVSHFFFFITKQPTLCKYLN